MADELEYKYVEAPVTVIKERIKKQYKDKIMFTTIILGPPGIGKSETVLQAAKELAEELNLKFEIFEFTWNNSNALDYRLIYNKAIKILTNPDKYFVVIRINGSNIEPVDLTGKPGEINIDIKDILQDVQNKNVKFADYIPFIWHLVASSCKGFLIIEDITNVSRPDLQSELYRVCGDRLIGWTKINDEMLVIATGNSPEHSAIANPFPTPLVSRCKIYRSKAPSVEEWIKYMSKKYKDKWDRRIGSFLLHPSFSDLFVKIPEDPETLDPYPCPRSWTILALSSKGLEGTELQIEAEATVGIEAANKLMIFVNTSIPDISEIISNPEIWNSFNFDQKYLTISALAHYISDNIEDEQKIVSLSGIFKVMKNTSKDLLMTLIFMLDSKVQDQLIDIAISNNLNDLLDVLDEALAQ